MPSSPSRIRPSHDAGEALMNSHFSVDNERFSGPHGHSYDSLVSCIKSFRDEPIIFVPNPGNAGDNIINLGIYRMLDRLGIKYTIGNHGGIYPDRVIFHGGGGSLVSHFPGADTFFRKNHPVCRQLVLFPHTIRSYSDMIAEMDERCHIFTREDNSFDYVGSHAKRAQVYKTHDMAFMLDKEYIQGLPWDISALRKKGLLRSWIVMMLKLKATAKLRDSTLHAFRIDNESRNTPLHPLNYDVSRLFSTGNMNVAFCRNSAKALLKAIGSFKSVETDRLHVSILSAIAGLPIIMNDNSYGKNFDVYSFSIKDYFSNLSFKV